MKVGIYGLKFGTMVRLPDGREGTVIYQSLDGTGIIWGRHAFTEDDAHRAATEHRLPWLGQEAAEIEGIPSPDAMLRDSYPSAALECVGSEYEAIE